VGSGKTPRQQIKGSATEEKGKKAAWRGRRWAMKKRTSPLASITCFRERMSR
jgi:hypothetical protein